MPLCITGMHRSCTSVVASMLQSAGVDIGRKLLGPTRANVRGNFEDLGFLHFHRDALAAQRLDPDGFIVTPRVPVPSQLVSRAEHLVRQRAAAGGCWGWKGPRATLFLDFWAGAVLDLKFLLLFRAPWEVVDSLFRRGDVVFRQTPDLAARVWLNYNQAILDFQARFPSRCLLLEGRAVAEQPDLLRAEVNRAFGLALGPVQPLCDPDLLRCPAGDHSRGLLGYFYPEALELYERLRERAAAIDPAEPREAVAESQPAGWALRHWADARAAERQAEELRRALDASRAETRALQGPLEKAHREAGTVGVPDGNAMSLKNPKRVNFKWSATGAGLANGVTYQLYVRKDGWPDWVALEKDLEKPEYEWDTTTVPAGVYRLKVVINAPRDTAGAAAPAAEGVSGPIVVCHTPPSVDVRTAGAEGDRVVVEATAVSPSVRLTAAAFAVNGNKWVSVFPTDGRFDGKAKKFCFKTAGLKPGTYVLVLRVCDAAGNTGSADVAFTVQAGAVQR